MPEMDPVTAAARLVDIRPEDFSPDALREHADVLDVLSEGLSDQARTVRDPEHRMVVEDMADDCRRFAGIFRGLADRDEGLP